MTTEQNPSVPQPQLSHPYVHRRAWTEALALADGDPARLRVISATSVLVMNRPGLSAPKTQVAEPPLGETGLSDDMFRLPVSPR
jgi:hypothetical protein